MKQYVRWLFVLLSFALIWILTRSFLYPQQTKISNASFSTPITIASATSSITKTGSFPVNAFDGRTDTNWESGSTAPQWIMLDLDTLNTVNRIKLIVAQSPKGRTVHEIWMGPTSSSLALIQRIDTITEKNQVIDIALLKPAPNTRYVKIITTQSPSWIAWKEIEVYSGTTKAETNLKYFGYLSSDYIRETPTYFSELASLDNTNIAWGMQNLNKFKDNGILVLYPVGAFFRDTSSTPAGRFSLLQNWQDLWRQDQEKINPHIDNIYGFYIDEPFWNGANLSDFQTYTKAIRDTYPDKAILVFEAGKSINGSKWENTIPSDYFRYVTDLGIDYYFTLESTNNHEGWNNFLNIYEKFKPYFNNKKIWFAPDGYGPVSYSNRWLDSYEKYLGLALTQPQTVGMLGFIYNIPLNASPENIGLKRLLDPNSLNYDSFFRSRQIEMGKAIISKANDSTIVPTPLPSPSPLPSSKPEPVLLSSVSATASLTRTVSSPLNAIDHNMSTSWESGAFAPQWIVIDLGQLSTISKIKLTVAQSPAGQTTHNIEVGSSPNLFTPLTTLSGITDKYTPIEYVLPAPFNARYVKIRTTKSPSWIAWKEIEIFGTYP